MVFAFKASNPKPNGCLWPVLLDKLLPLIRYGVNHGINGTNLSMFRVFMGHMLFWFHRVHSREPATLSLMGPW